MVLENKERTEGYVLALSKQKYDSTVQLLKKKGEKYYFNNSTRKINDTINKKKSYDTFFRMA